MRRLVRSCFTGGGYVYATRAEEIARAAGHTRCARLASNESPFPPSPLAIERAVQAMRRANRYPPEVPESLCRALKRLHGDYPVAIGNGMDGVIETLMRTLVDPGDTVVIATPTFSFYGVAATAQGASIRTVPRRKDFSVDVAAFVDACRGAKIAFLCTPNNPTGTLTPVEAVEEILKSIDGLLFLDNAYVEFSETDYLPLLKDHDNLVIGRTMSKIYALAGLRLGYAFMPAWLLPYYRKAATPFAVNAVTAAAAEGALADRDLVERTRAHVRAWREIVRDRVNFPTFPSEANFVLVDVRPHTGDAVMERLAARGVLVRSCTSFPMLGDHYIRVSIGDAWENERFLEEMNRL
ncbi:MAG: histidinol-phosphate transaminase [Methanomicrobiales archaeon]|nr:histidinol-phosphate transaminase [Methanomicrobiales archaeon]MDI6875342.1 histidinol-phosphate transaminase [Methanomicrobiales archaeon]